MDFLKVGLRVHWKVGLRASLIWMDFLTAGSRAGPKVESLAQLMGSQMASYSAYLMVGSSVLQIWRASQMVCLRVIQRVDWMVHLK